jgi:two-component system, OmpR family, sensor kinase
MASQAAMIERTFHLGFRARVLGSFVALVAGATFAGLIVQRAVLLDRLDREVDASLEQELGELQSLAGPSGINPETGLPFGGDVRAIFETFLRRNIPHEGEVFVAFVDGAYFRSTPSPQPLYEDPVFVERIATTTTAEWGRLSTESGPVRYLAVPVEYEGETQGVFVVANFLRGEREEVESSIRVAAAVAAGILLVAMAIAWLVAGRLLRPVRELTDAAESITDTDLHRRIPVVGNDEIARLTRQFNGMLDRLAAAFAAQRAFVDDAGHELRTPITIVRGHLELMGSDPVERQETIDLVTEELDRMSRFVDDLLTLAKAEQLDFVQKAPLEIAEFTTDVLVKARALGNRDWHMDACATGDILADRQRLTQAMLNLARNAVEHTPADAEVAIGSEWDDSGLRLWVRDTGPGIEPADQLRVFERFARGGQGPRRSDGAGLGLAIVRTIVDAHGGRVILDSHPGQGSRFTIVLPGRPSGTTWPAPTNPQAVVDEVREERVG